MNCFSNTDAIKIFKGDDTDFCGKNFITFRFVSDLDLSSFTGVFKLGEYKQVQNIFNNEMVVNIPHEATSKYQVGTMSGIFRLIDNSGKIATVTNSIPFQITQKPFTQEHSVVELEVPESYPVTINLEIGIQNGDYSILQHKPSINGVTLVGYKTSEDLGLATSSDVQTVQENLNTHIENLSNPHEVTKSQVGLGNVDNTADLDKPISTATQAALNTKVEDVLLNGASIVTNKVASFTLGTMAQESASDYSTKAVADTLYADISYEATVDNHIANTSNPHSVTKEQVGLGNVDNTSDANKSISTATQAALDGKQATLSTAQLDAVNSGIDSTKVAQIATNTGNISTIEVKIPEQASISNQLADKEFVNSSIATNTANFIGTFESVSDLQGYSGTVTNNDYAFVVNGVITDNGSDWETFSDLDGYDKSLLTEFDYAWVINGSNFDLYRFDILEQSWNLRASNISKSSVTLNTAYNRYKATVTGSVVTWAYEYTLNNSSFTASQWAAINSGITSSLVTQIGTNTTAIEGKQDIINDLSTIRSGASAGATAVQPSSLATVATTGNYNDLTNKPNIPTVNDATLTIQKNGANVATFTANSSSNATANITVPTQASDIGAQETLVSGTNIKTVNNTSLLGSGNISIDSLPSQTGQSGKFLTTDGTDASWASVEALPSQSGQSGKYLTTNGSTASWDTINALQNTATGTNSLTILGNVANANYSLNIGKNSTIYSARSISIGEDSASSIDSVSIGYKSFANDNSVSIGCGDSNAGAKSDSESVVIGAKASCYTGMGVANSCVVVGYQASSSETQGTAVGVYAKVSGNSRGTALGSYSKAQGLSATAVGYQAYSTADYAIQLGFGTNSNTKTLSVGLDYEHNYQLLDATGTIPSARLPVATTSAVGGVKVDGTTITISNGVISAAGGGSSAPTLTWYKNNTGTTVTISDTSSANLVKVYKNGILLEPTEDYSISGTTLTLVTALIATDKIAVEVF